MYKLVEKSDFPNFTLKCLRQNENRYFYRHFEALQCLLMLSSYIVCLNVSLFVLILLRNNQPQDVLVVTFDSRSHVIS